jgi:hypothetical protein
MHLDERTDHLLGSIILILSDLLVFLFHPLPLGRRAPCGCVQVSETLLFMESRH